MKKQFAWILGGAWLVGMGVVASMSACSGDDTNTTDSGTKDQSVSDTAKQDVATQDQNNGDTGNPQDAGADCKTVPSGWPYVDDGGEGPFCPYQGDGSTFSNCPATEHCCVPASGNSTCQVATCLFTADASTNADFQCEQSADCVGAGMVCCEINTNSVFQQDLGCTTYDFVTGQKGASCVATSCPTGRAQLCAGNAECTGGKTCFPLNTKGTWMGVCLGADGGI